MQNTLANELRKRADGSMFELELKDIADEIEKRCIELPVGADGEPIAIGDRGRSTSSKKMHYVDGFINNLENFCLVLSNGDYVLPEDFTHETPYNMEKLLADLEDLKRGMERNACIHSQNIHSQHAYSLGEIIEKGKQI